MKTNIQDRFVIIMAGGRGSAVVNQIAEHGKSPELVSIVGAFVKSLAVAVKTV